METNTEVKTIEEKKHFLKNEVYELFQKLKTDDKGEWGVLNAQQMIEHLSDSFRNYHGLDSKKIITPPGQLPKYKEFLLSEKPFKPYTKNIEMPETPLPCRLPDMQTALKELKSEINNFFDYFEKDKNKTMTNVFFGELSFEESIQLLHKHAMHHLNQFRLIDASQVKK